MSKFYRIIRYDWPLHFVLLFTNWLPDNILFIRLRGFLASFFFGKCGRNLRVGRSNIFYNPKDIHLGSDVYMAHNNWFCAGGVIRIDNQVLIGPYNCFVAAAHSKFENSYRYGAETKLNIEIGFGSWITSHCVISGGTIVGKGVMLGANSFAKGKLEDDTFYAGSPAEKKTISQ